ncbi:MAG: hypothetical protein A2Z16_06475, partial [Chloroflexi bacterium RBG_16_54_18]
MSNLDYPEYLAFGDIGIDIGVSIPHLPRPDEKLWADMVGEFPGGMAANAASAFTALGGKGGVVATIGPDRFGQIAMDDLQTRGVDIRSVRLGEDPTFWTLALLTPDGEKSLVQFHTPAVSANWLTFDWSLLPKASIVHAIPDDEIQVLHLFERSRESGLINSLDFEGSLERWPRLEKVLALTDILFTNRPTAESLNTEIERAAHQFKAMGAGNVAITLGDQGCLLLDGSNDFYRIPGHRVTAVDTTGAGDCFAGAFAFGWFNGWTPLECAQLANLMAAMSTTAYGSRGRLLSGKEISDLAKQTDYD